MSACIDLARSNDLKYDHFFGFFEILSIFFSLLLTFNLILKYNSLLYTCCLGILIVG